MQASTSSLVRLTPSYRPNPGQEILNECLAGPQRHTLAVGGARSGKTFLIMRAIVIRAVRGAGSRHVVLRFRSNAARSSIALDTLPKVVKVCFPGLTLSEHRQDGYFDLPNGSQIWVGGLDDKDRTEKILGNEYATMFFNECSQIPYSSILLARTRLAQKIEGLRQRAYYDLNPTGKTHWTNREFVQHIDPLTERPLTDQDNYRHVFLQPKDNAENLTPEFLAELAALPEKQRKRFWDGVYVDEVDGALWTYEVLEQCRMSADEPLPEMRSVVVAVDPSGASGDEDKRSDEIGISVVGKGVDGIAYVLGDYSLRDSPERWARAAVAAYHKHQADRIIAEQNYGGAMVHFTIKSADATVPVKVINASRGKHVRAEPVSLLYEDGKVRHVGRFPKLEDQLVNFSSAGYIGERSPDRADALVWAITELMLGNATPRASSGTFSWG